MYQPSSAPDASDSCPIRGIDYDEIEFPLNRANGIDELLKFGGLVVRDLHGLATLNAAMHREFEVETGAARPGAPVVDVARKALLAAIEIDGGDPLARLHQGNGDVQGYGGFARPALFVTQHNDMS